MAQNAYRGLLQPYSEEFFQKSVVDPSLRQYREQILPEIGQQYSNVNAGSSSALNQALAKSAQDLAGSLASQRLGLQQMSQQANLGALGQLQGLLGVRSFEPLIQGPRAGILGDILKALGSVGGTILGGPIGGSLGNKLFGG